MVQALRRKKKKSNTKNYLLNNKYNTLKEVSFFKKLIYFKSFIYRIII